MDGSVSKVITVPAHRSLDPQLSWRSQAQWWDSMTPVLGGRNKKILGRCCPARLANPHGFGIIERHYLKKKKK